jgi:hypothetical protein
MEDVRWKEGQVSEISARDRSVPRGPRRITTRDRVEMEQHACVKEEF